MTTEDKPNHNVGRFVRTTFRPIEINIEIKNHLLNVMDI